jgi:hypothetical protein
MTRRFRTGALCRPPARRRPAARRGALLTKETARREPGGVQQSLVAAAREWPPTWERDNRLTGSP